MSNDTLKLRSGAPALPPSAAPADGDPRARAAARAAELRARGGLEQDTDKFSLAHIRIPDGWSYEWKRLEVLGKQDPSYQVSLAQTGWEPVPRSRHPELMPDTYHGETIIREGLILMERPGEITDEVRRRDSERAREQVRAKEEQLGGAPPGTFSRDNQGAPMAKISKTLESMQIPEK